MVKQDRVAFFNADVPRGCEIINYSQGKKKIEGNRFGKKKEGKKERNKKDRKYYLCMCMEVKMKRKERKRRKK